jgi:hypothetical protein
MGLGILAPRIFAHIQRDLMPRIPLTMHPVGADLRVGPSRGRMRGASPPTRPLSGRTHRCAPTMIFDNDLGAP